MLLQLHISAPHLNSEILISENVCSRLMLLAVNSPCFCNLVTFPYFSAKKELQWRQVSCYSDVAQMDVMSHMLHIPACECR